MGEGVAIIVAAIAVGVLIYIKPDFFWNAPQMRRARSSFTDAEAQRIAYIFLLFVMGITLAILLWQG